MKAHRVRKGTGQQALWINLQGQVVERYNLKTLKIWCCRPRRPLTQWCKAAPSGDQRRSPPPPPPSFPLLDLELEVSLSFSRLASTVRQHVREANLASHLPCPFCPGLRSRATASIPASVSTLPFNGDVHRQSNIGATPSRIEFRRDQTPNNAPTQEQ